MKSNIIKKDSFYEEIPLDNYSLEDVSNLMDKRLLIDKIEEISNDLETKTNEYGSELYEHKIKPHYSAFIEHFQKLEILDKVLNYLKTIKSSDNESYTRNINSAILGVLMESLPEKSEEPDSIIKKRDLVCKDMMTQALLYGSEITKGGEPHDTLNYVHAIIKDNDYEGIMKIIISNL